MKVYQDHNNSEVKLYDSPVHADVWKGVGVQISTSITWTTNVDSILHLSHAY